MAARDLSTFWILLGSHGATMTLEDIRNAFFPELTLKTMRNKASAGLLPRRAGDVFDTRDVADWWDDWRKG
jgi:hypothetical protein